MPSGGEERQLGLALAAEAGGGSIVNMASEVAFSGSPGLAHYVASKAAVVGLTRTLARELGHGDAASLLDQTLDEESNADSILTKIATGGMLRSGVNKEAVSRK